MQRGLRAVVRRSASCRQERRQSFWDGSEPDGSAATEPGGRLTVVHGRLGAVDGRPGAGAVHGGLGAEHGGSSVGRGRPGVSLCSPGWREDGEMRLLIMEAGSGF